MVEHAALEKLIGTVLSNYRLEKLLQQSKWGPVFQASSATGAVFSVYLMPTPFQQSRSEQAALPRDTRIVFLGRFQQEANRIAALQHPHILPLLDYGSYRSMPYLVYPGGPMTSLRSLLAQKVPDDLLVIGRYLDQIAAALEYAHQYGVTHRNLSTASIFMRENRQLVVTEFGLTRIRELNALSSQPERTLPFDGSSESSAPEQLLGKPVDAYTDIYALGAVLYRLLTGHPPFPGKTREEVGQQHLYSEVPSLTTWRSELPDALDSLIMKAMAKEPMQRYSQPIALAQAYHRIVASGVPYSSLIAPAPVMQMPAAEQKKGWQRLPWRIGRKNPGFDNSVYGSWEG